MIRANQSISNPPRRRTDGGGFVFLDPGELIDRELELVAPHERWIDDMLSACAHPLVARLDPKHAQMTRKDLEEFLKSAPDGHEPADRARGRVPSYHFWMRLRPEFDPPVPMAGGLGLRVGRTHDLQMYYGQIGYHVYPPARGCHYAERACRLIFDLARAHGLGPLWITTDPENVASRRTCERLGGKLVEIVDVPEGNPLHARGQRRKCRYRLDF